MVISILKFIFLIVGAILMFLPAFSVPSYGIKYNLILEGIGFFLICIVAFYPYTIKKIIQKMKRKKFAKKMAFMDGSYVFDDESSEFKHSIQVLNRLHKKKILMFSITIIAVLSFMVAFLTWYYHKLESQNFYAPVFFKKYMTAFLYTIVLTPIGTFMILGILKMFFINEIMYNNKDVKNKFLELYSHKETIMSEIVKKVNPKYIYSPIENLQKYKELAGDEHAPYMQLDTLYKSSNFDKNYDYFYANDCILGKTDKNKIFKLADIRVVTHVKGRRSHDVTNFEGLFLCVEKSNNIYSGIKIRRKGLNTTLWNKFTQKSSEKLNDEFKELLKYYAISAKNVKSVNEHIGDRLIDYLLQVKNESPFEFDILFDDENTYLRVFTGKVFSQNSIKKEKIDFYYSIIKYTTDMINNLSNLIK